VAISESERRELHAAVEQGIGTRAADLLLAMTEPELPFVLRAEMADLKTELRAEMGELRVEMADLKIELRAEMGQLRSEMADLKTELRAEMTGLRGDMARLESRLDARIGSQVPKLWAANMASMVGVAGLVLAAGALV
jgi:chromosome segregation ATPase